MLWCTAENGGASFHARHPRLVGRGTAADADGVFGKRGAVIGALLGFFQRGAVIVTVIFECAPCGGMSSYCVEDPSPPSKRYVFSRRPTIDAQAICQPARARAPMQRKMSGDARARHSSPTVPEAGPGRTLLRSHSLPVSSSLTAAAGVHVVPAERRCVAGDGCVAAATRRCVSCEEFKWFRSARLCDGCFARLHVRLYCLLFVHMCIALEDPPWRRSM